MNEFVGLTTMMAREIDHRVFSLARENIREFGRTMGPRNLLRLVEAVCQSYDQVQLNAEDDVTHGRVDMVQELVQCVMESASSSLVLPETALAFGFYPFSRAAFIELCCRYRPKNLLSTIFSPKTVGSIVRPGLLRNNSEVGEICLRNLYWGRGCEEHALQFMQLGMAPFFTSRHLGEMYKSRFHSLVIEPPKRSFMYTMAMALELDLLHKSNISLTENLFDIDPHCEYAPNIADSLAVARALKVDYFFKTRFHVAVWPHVESINSPFYYSEKAIAAELLICVLEPLRLPPYALLEIIDRVYDMGIHRRRFVDNVKRVYLKTDKLRALHALSNKK